MGGYTVPDKIAALRRELSYRRRVYRKRVEEGAMPQTEAERQIDIFEAILKDYEDQVQARLL